MENTALVTGSETLLGRKLIEKLLARGYRVIAPIPGKAVEKDGTSNDRLTVIPWNRASWFSAKTVVRESLRRNGRIDAALLLHKDPKIAAPFAQAEPSDVEEVLEGTVKGTVALARELRAALGASEGILAFAVPHRTGQEPGPLDALALGAFLSFAQSLMAQPAGEAWTCGFRSVSTDADGYAEAILDSLGKKPPRLRGRWLFYADGRRPFGGPAVRKTVK